MLRIIKKYRNRNLYDTHDRKQTSLVEISKMLSRNVKLKVVDNRTGRDITNLTLANAILEKEKNSDNYPYSDRLVESGQDSIAVFFEKHFPHLRVNIDGMLDAIYDKLLDKKIRFDEKLGEILKPVVETANRKYVKEIEYLRKEIDMMKLKYAKVMPDRISKQPLNKEA